ncbi:MAG: VanZ family protein [Bacillota bacterium]|nr:VanZ family protein [Bacillota bacterium]
MVRKRIAFLFCYIFGSNFYRRYVIKEKENTSISINSGRAFFFFLVVVLASTVFTRTSNGIRTYELVPFWSWYEIAKGNKELFEEVVLNLFLLLPAGMLLPFVFDKKIKWYKAFALGFMFSAFIEVCQLVLCRGLFEWDNMIDNALGAMAGCIMSNKAFEKFCNKNNGRNI